MMFSCSESYKHLLDKNVFNQNFFFIRSCKIVNSVVCSKPVRLASCLYVFTLDLFENNN